ncbi:MAG: hypothetical protein K6F58_01515 [Bacteroidales bacterium]|nr:hypothetical protein [Bacteroidales bacterium]
MFYNYRVTLKGIKGFFRLYTVAGSNSLYVFHKQLRSDLEFPQDQPILFKAFGADGAVLARYALINIGSGAVDEVSIEDTLKAGVTSFEYFYDTVSKKSVTITFEGQSARKVALPTLEESKGPLPIEFENGYVAFEDLPEDKRRRAPAPEGFLASLVSEGDEAEEDLDEEEDEEDEDREEEELVYEEEGQEE